MTRWAGVDGERYFHASELVYAAWMAKEITYLELSEGSAHKFYEVTVDGAELTIRYGRIGDNGQSSTSKLASAEKARAEADKKLAEKRKKGYEAAKKGERQKRAVTKRSDVIAQAAKKKPSSAKVKQAPLLWKFDTKRSALGIFVDRERLWVGNENGEVYSLDHELAVHQKLKLPDGVKCIVADEGFLYAGCDDGNVYDLSGKVPRVAYTIAEDVDLYWLDIHDGILAVSDALGNVTTVDHEDESRWAKKSKGDKGWMVRCDEIGVYHGHSKGVTMYDWESGDALWSRPTVGWIGFGWQEESVLFASTAEGKVHKFTKKGDVRTVYDCDAYLCSCASSPDGEYVFAGDQYGNIYCFAEGGERLWKLDSGCGAAQSMQYHDGKLYVVTHLGFLGCIDASESAILAAKAGTVPDAKVLAAPKVDAAKPDTMESTKKVEGGVLVECFDDGGKLRVRVAQKGYHADWNCQFPKALREKGAKYVVDEARESTSGKFYRVYGNIKKLVK